jgi:hypothetical protein
MIVYCLRQVLAAPQIPFGCLNGGVTEQELDLLQFPARLPAEFGAGTPQVVRRNTWR